MAIRHSLVLAVGLALVVYFSSASDVSAAEEVHAIWRRAADLMLMPRDPADGDPTACPVVDGKATCSIAMSDSVELMQLKAKTRKTTIDEAENRPFEFKQADDRPFEFKQVGCGMKGVDHSPLIVNGQDASECEWKWQVSLRKGNFHFCGGTLISPRWVYTAAHCMGSSNFQVVVGDYLRKTNGDQYQATYNVAQIVKHPGYNSQTMDYDHALVKLTEDVPANACVGYACIPEADIPAGSTCYITGWGTLQSGGSSPDKLQEAPVVIQTNDQCNQGAYNGKITDNMICAQGELNGKITDACQGDSGGPLVCEVGGKYGIFGTTSWGYGCAQANAAGVWGRTHYVKSWIMQTMSGSTNPTPSPSPSNPSPSPSGPWTIESGVGCEVSGGACIQSKNFPNAYGNHEGCTIKVAAGTVVTRKAFNTEEGYDWLTIDGQKYSGTEMPHVFTPSSISWTSDNVYVKTGWQVCAGSGSSPSPSPSPTLQGPPGPAGPPGPKGPPGPPR